MVFMIVFIAQKDVFQLFRLSSLNPFIHYPIIEYNLSNPQETMFHFFYSYISDELDFILIVDRIFFTSFSLQLCRFEESIDWTDRKLPHERNRMGEKNLYFLLIQSTVERDIDCDRSNNDCR
ncbi:hypothetical protein NH340_JMT00268 [Sarcoptes scabiei]|nr:hypothetical protein NH340_JMT00268 [Sarcoptes scabiei]